jgi:hypothetical protein
VRRVAIHHIGSLAAVVSPRSSVHRRCSPCHVSYRRRGDQSCHSRCHRGSQCPGSALREDAITAGDLAKVQRRRALPTRLTQGFQVIIQKQVIARVLAAPERVELPWPQRLILRSKFLSRIRGRIVGIGFRPEHVKTPDLLR